MMRITIHEYCSFVFTLLYYDLIVYIYAAPEINCSLNDVTMEVVFLHISKLNINILSTLFPIHGLGVLSSIDTVHILT